MKNIKETVTRNNNPVRVLQFGEGNFLRAFVDYMIDIAVKKGQYNGDVVIVQPINAPLMKHFADQDSVYTVVLRGKENGETVDKHHVVTTVREVISSYSDYERFMSYASLDSLEVIVSNTTEAGIVLDESDLYSAEPPHTYPGKLTKFLHARFEAFGGDAERGLVILPVELIENNGGKLKECVLRLAEIWGLGDGFAAWVKDSCEFCNTLVDRIVTGYPKKSGEAEIICESLGYKDNLIDICEPFGLWVIEASDIDRVKKALPLDKAGLPVIFTNDQKPYRDRKVRILNGAHTSFVPAAFLSGQNIVRDSMANRTIRAFVDRCIYGDVIPTLTLPREELLAFADSVCERFENPFIDHELLSICLNSVSKWRARVLPSLIESLKNTGKLPPCLLMSFAALCEFYAGGVVTAEGFVGTRELDGVTESYKIADDADVIEFFAEHGKSDDVLERFASREDFWGMDLSSVEGFVCGASRMLKLIREKGAAFAMKTAVEESEELDK